MGRPLLHPRDAGDRALADALRELAPQRKLRNNNNNDNDNDDNNNILIV